MKILHIQLAGPYTEGASYQENLLPRYQARLGHEIYILTSCYAWKEGDLVHVDPCKKTIENGIILERLDYSHFINRRITTHINYVKNLYDKIVEIQPDFVMVHDVQSFSDEQICKYLMQHPEVKAITDCHTDYSNSARNVLSNMIIHRILWKSKAQKLNKCITKFYGTLPAREDFLKKNYGIPANKVDLLIMGADDDLVNEAIHNRARDTIRDKWGINKQDFLIVTGGKIDAAKTQTLLLMEAVKNIPNKQLKMIVFGSVDDELKDRFNKLVDGDKIQYVGWIASELAYQYFAAADLVCFPGRHSVLWEQVVAMGVPLVVKLWDGTCHVDIGGNARFIAKDTVEEIERILKEILEGENVYSTMLEAARSERKNAFLYSNIAKKSLEIASDLDEN